MKIAGYVALIICVCSLFAFPVVADDDVGIPVYPNATEMPGATERLLKMKAPTWLAARVYHTNDSIKTVVKYFHDHAPKPAEPVANEIIRRLLDDNWRIANSTVPWSHAVFGVGDELQKTSKQDSKTSFGVFVLNDSVVRVHLMSPHPSDADNNKLDEGTMIVLIRERIGPTTQTAATAGDDEPVYTGREVTRRVRIRSKPDPSYVAGIRGLVILKAIFSGSGKVTKVVVVQGVDGLTEEAIKAARKIEFDPAIKDGRPVAQWLQVEYRFF